MKTSSSPGLFSQETFSHFSLPPMTQRRAPRVVVTGRRCDCGLSEALTVPGALASASGGTGGYVTRHPKTPGNKNRNKKHALIYRTTFCGNCAHEICVPAAGMPPAEHENAKTPSTETGKNENAKTRKRRKLENGENAIHSVAR